MRRPPTITHRGCSWNEREYGAEHTSVSHSPLIQRLNILMLNSCHRINNVTMIFQEAAHPTKELIHFQLPPSPLLLPDNINMERGGGGLRSRPRKANKSSFHKKNGSEKSHQDKTGGVQVDYCPHT